MRPTHVFSTARYAACLGIDVNALPSHALLCVCDEARAIVLFNVLHASVFGGLPTWCSGPPDLLSLTVILVKQTNHRNVETSLPPSALRRFRAWIGCHTVDFEARVSRAPRPLAPRQTPASLALRLLLAAALCRLGDNIAVLLLVTLLLVAMQPVAQDPNADCEHAQRWPRDIPSHTLESTLATYYMCRVCRSRWDAVTVVPSGGRCCGHRVSKCTVMPEVSDGVWADRQTHRIECARVIKHSLYWQFAVQTGCEMEF